MESQIIGEFLSKLRKENNLKQKDISNLCNVSSQAVSKWERGVSIPDVLILEKLSILYKISINEILNGEKNELYFDYENRNAIISLVNSIMVFIAYLFVFVRAESETGGTYYINLDVTTKGYELIFNGISGGVVYLAWIIFMVLLSHLILNIFVISKVVKRTDNLISYLYISAIAIIVLTNISVLSSIFLPFPQFLIMISMGITLFINHESSSGNGFFDNLREYQKNKKNDTLPKNLILDIYEDKLIYLKVSKVLIAISAYLYLIFSVYGITVLFQSVDYALNDQQYLELIITIVAVISIIFLIYKLFTFIGSIYTDKILLFTSILITLLPIYILLQTSLRVWFPPFGHIIAYAQIFAAWFIYFSSLRLKDNKTKK